MPMIGIGDVLYMRSDRVLMFFLVSIKFSSLLDYLLYGAILSEGLENDFFVSSG